MPGSIYYNNSAGDTVHKQRDGRLADRRISKIEEQLLEEQDESMIQYPWDDDTFSLCLENFPSAQWAKRFCPFKASPLRKRWIESSDDEDEQEQAVSSTSSPQENNLASSATSISSLSINGSTPKKSKSKLSLFYRAGDNTGTFPYNNNSQFLNEKDQSSVISHGSSVLSKSTQPQRGHVEHISPFSNITDDLLYRSPVPTSKKLPGTAQSSIRSKPSTSSSLMRPFKSFSKASSVNGDSVVSDTETMESWKMVQHPRVAPVLPPHRLEQYNPTPSNVYQHFQYTPSTRSGASTPTAHHDHSYPGSMTPVALYNNNALMTPLQPLHYNPSIHSNRSGYYSPEPISYQSMPVAKNADHLMYFSPVNSASSVYSTDMESEYTEKNRSYSQYFNPAYQHGQGKKSRSTKRLGSLLSKLVKNIRHHFGKQQPQTI